MIYCTNVNVGHHSRKCLNDGGNITALVYGPITNTNVCDSIIK